MLFLALVLGVWLIVLHAVDESSLPRVHLFVVLLFLAGAKPVAGDSIRLRRFVVIINFTLALWAGVYIYGIAFDCPYARNVYYGIKTSELALYFPTYVLLFFWSIFNIALASNIIRRQQKKVWTKLLIILAVLSFATCVFLLPRLVRQRKIGVSYPGREHVSSAKKEIIKKRYAKQIQFLKKMTARSTVSGAHNFMKAKHYRKAGRIFQNCPEILKAGIYPAKTYSAGVYDEMQKNTQSENTLYYSEYAKNANGNYVKIYMEIAPKIGIPKEGPSK